MTALSALLDAPAATTLAWTLMHFLWQGTVFAVLLALVMRYAGLTAAGRYAAGVTTLALMLAAPLATFTILVRQTTPVEVSGGTLAALAAGTDTGIPVDLAALRSSDAAAGDASIAAIVVAVWAAGVLVLATRLCGGWWLARRLVRRGSAPVSAEIESMAVRMAGRLALDRVVRVAQSSAVAVPVMVGWLKPIVLFPASVLGGLSPTQIEALLAHELAHVRRHDYLVNLLQSVVETMLFYHPAVWWVSRVVRVEREHCCDDMALSVCDRLVYATALSDLAALAAPPRVALAATDGSLLQRVRRILAGEQVAHERGASWVPVLGVVIIAGLLVPIALLRARADASAEAAMAEQVAGGAAGGVAAGVPGGVPGGVVGGVPGAVAGGVSGDVAEGVPAGVAGGEPRDEPRGASFARYASSQSDQEIARRVQEMQREAELRLREVEDARQKLAQERLDAQYRAQIEQHQTELESMLQDRNRMRRMVEVGTLSHEQLSEVERRIAALEQRMTALQMERKLELRELELRGEQERRTRELEKAQIELERAERGMASEASRRDAEAARDRVGRSAQSMERLARELAEASVPMSGQEPIRSGDVLVIDIHGEPDVPRAYAVSADGTIRLPLSRPIRVVGLTAQQLTQTIVKQLTARGLETVAVEVRLRRPRIAR